jgi:hypothetical protein
VNSELLSKDIIWKPTGSQGEMEEFRNVRPGECDLRFCFECDFAAGRCGGRVSSVVWSWGAR